MPGTAVGPPEDHGFGEELQTWRQQMIRSVFRAALVFGAIAVPVAALATRLPVLRPFYVGIYVLFVLVLFLRPRSYHLQAWACLALVYSWGVLALLEDGLHGDGRVFLLTLPLLAALLLGERIGLAALALSLLTLAAFGGAFAGGVVTIPAEDQVVANDLLSWLSGTLVWLAMGATTVVALNYLVRRIVAALERSRRLAQELESQQATLEDQVAARTHELAEKAEALNELVATQQHLLDTIREMSTPVVPLGEDILIMPLVGVIDSERARQVMAGLLAGIEAHKARVVLLDITGVPVVDTSVAGSLLQATRAARLLGTEAILVGLRPEIAQTIVSLGVDLGELVTCSNLRQGLERAQQKLRLARAGRR